MAFKKLHKNGGYKPEDLQTVKEYKDLVKTTYDVFNYAISDNDMPEDMSRALQSDAFLFGGLKANAQLFEASQLLLNSDGTLKPFKELSNQFEKLNVQYNQNYLEAEYQFAVTSSQMASKWLEFGTEDRYNLQYRTAKDERVRASHQKLADITLPKTDAFWISYYPPNGWNCRCTVAEVLKDKYDKSDSSDSIKKGEAATTEIGKNGKNRLEMFRFNPGMQKIVFPPKHTYSKVKGAGNVKAQSKTKPKSKRTAFELNDDTEAELKELGFDVYKSSNAADFFNRNFKGFNFIELDGELDKIFEKSGIDIIRRSIDFYDNSFTINYKGENNFYLQRQFRILNERKNVYHAYFEVPRSLQGTGISKSVFNSLYKQYRAAKVADISVHANLDVGGYTWGKYGFSCNNKAELKIISNKAASLHKEGTLTDVEYNDFTRIFKENLKGKLFPMYEIAQTKYAKKLLLNTSWHGILNLNSNLQRKIFENYLNGS